MIEFERIEQFDNGPARLTLVFEALHDRAPAIIVTCLAVVAFFTPFAMMEGAAGLELAYPAAVTAIGGVIASVPLTLVIVPALYFRFGAGIAAAAAQEDAALGSVSANT
jgi:multidrug efflux pump subunit AcrB